MARNFLKGVAEGVKEGVAERMNQTSEEWEELRQEKIDAKAEKRLERELESLPREIYDLMGTDEEALYAFTFWNDKMIVTNKKLVYMDLKIAKNKTFAMIPFNRITSYSLLIPTGPLSVKGKLKIFTGGSTESLVVESVFNDGLNEFCKILADFI